MRQRSSACDLYIYAGDGDSRHIAGYFDLGDQNGWNGGSFVDATQAATLSARRDFPGAGELRRIRDCLGWHSRPQALHDPGDFDDPADSSPGVLWGRWQ